MRARAAQMTRPPRALYSVDLSSRAGEGGALWTILTVSLVAGVAAIVLGPLGTRLREMGKKALADVDAAKTW
jgi:hypothetical protein